MSWSSSDNFFVNAKLEVCWVDLFSKSLELTQSKGVFYDGPKVDDFKRLLRSKNFRVNRQGKAIVRVQKRDDDGEFLECQYDTFILETVVPLGPFGFQNIPLPKPKEVNELQSLLENTKAESAKKNDELTEWKSLLENTNAELAKKNDELTELQSLLKNIKAESAKKNDELTELQSLLENAKAEMAKKNDTLNELMKQKIDQDWNREQFRLAMIAINNSMKRVFIEYGLEPPANGDQESVLRFLEMLRDLLLHKEFNTTFIVAVNMILASMASIFEKRTGLSIGMETTNSTPACLIKSLSTLRDFIVDSHFFIDGSVIVRDFHLMNEDDLLVIFRDSATDVAELKKKEIGVKPINNIDTKSIFYGYFNIPMVGMFKGVLTRVHLTLPDEIMVKLQVGKHNLNNKRFWFVHGNGSGIFEKEESNLGSPDNLEVVKFAPTRVLGDSTDFIGFFCRMSRIFVNEKGTYLKFDFIAGKFSGSRVFPDSTVRYYTKDGGMFDPFKLVQFDVNTSTTDIISREVYLPTSTSGIGDKYPSWMLNEALGKDCAFTFNDFCFMGKITRVSGTFRENALVNVFFEQSQHKENCYVDALATTFFVLRTERAASWGTIGGSAAPKFI
ncbi:uncharacterized protein LOC122084770 [Macadamia integrifolia]|uniref:uncharacterized protein LOC122084770 n=1 Tax=Macadamia integrifolia TaxID=60698 RepID=UPI001C4EAEF1|nr:uncharacterized protein LOC122084770 [Macadamia integrifolia]